MKIIVISGTPGTGKSSISKKIEKLVKCETISLNDLVLIENFNVKYDAKRKTQVIDTERLLPYLIDLIERLKEENLDYLIIEGHFSDILPEAYIDYAIILRCDPDVLSARLKERNYSDEKIIENLQAEILGNCANYFIQKNLKSSIYEIDTTYLTIESIAKIVINDIVENHNAGKHLVGKIDWLEKVFQEDRMDEFFKNKE